MALLLVFLQQQGRSCHHIPLEVAGLLCLAVLVAEGNWQWASGGPRPTAAALGAWAAAALVFGVFLVAWFVERKEGPDPPAVAARREIVLQHSRPGDRVLVVATTVDPADPLLLKPSVGRAAVISIRSQLLCSTRARSHESRWLPVSRRAIPRRGSAIPRRVERRRCSASTAAGADPEQPPLHRPACGFQPVRLPCPRRFGRGGPGPYDELPGPEGWKVFARKEVVRNSCADRPKGQRVASTPRPQISDYICPFSLPGCLAMMAACTFPLLVPPTS